MQPMLPKTISEAHLHRYLTEFDFRYNNRVGLGVNDGERAPRALKGIEGKRLTYVGLTKPRTLTQKSVPLSSLAKA
jgi:hypothetical protein